MAWPGFPAKTRPNGLDWFSKKNQAKWPGLVFAQKTRPNGLDWFVTKTKNQANLTKNQAKWPGLVFYKKKQAKWPGLVFHRKPGQMAWTDF